MATALSRRALSQRIALASTSSAPLSSSSVAAASGITRASFSTSKPSAAPSPSSESARPRRQLIFTKKSGQSNFKTFLPISPGLRHLRQPISEHLHKGGPHRPLTVAKRATGGRNDSGRITTRARGGGHKRRIRLLDFRRIEQGEQDVVRIEYDPGRSAHIALLQHRETKYLSYILAPATLRAGDVVQSFRFGIPDSFMIASTAAPTASAPSTPVVDPGAPQTVLPPSAALSLPGVRPAPGARAAPTPSASSRPLASLAQIDLGVLRSVAIRPGNCLPIRLIPVGTVIHAITLAPNGAAVLARSAGSSARIISAQSASGKHAQIRLSSGEVRLVGLECFASIGTVSNPDHQHRNLGKAGRKRWLGFRPQSRGVAMNATDHPHGGGRGKSKGNNHPMTYNAKGAKGQRTRAPTSKNGNKFVVKERPKRSEKRRSG
ncbi:BQ2448_5493 [Microbotryum intermedium]|uniref:Large ribosomal subunit protein uL2m n=1 Tax=Microbotryum intermedium TaxID=269621 RepID=A0A238F131_9BASI|nr:BQ2448_5493 [Microbotryum intermedium]